MGTDVHVLVHGPDPAPMADRAATRIEQLEARWSRFLPNSEISRLNEADGGPCLVSDDTCELVEVSCDAWRSTDGRFDPTQVDALRRLGYDAPWPAGSLVDHLPVSRPAAGCDGVVVNRRLSTVSLPRGVRLDPGGIGKGLAADLVARELMAAGATGALVNVGGDVRVQGSSPDGGPWCLDVEVPTESTAGPVARVRLVEGGVATSSTARRHWTLTDGTVVHHVLDPTTGLPAVSPFETVTVVAGSGWWAEALATSILLGDRLDGEHDCAALAVDHDGRLHLLGDRPERFFVRGERFAHPAGS